MSQYRRILDVAKQNVWLQVLPMRPPHRFVVIALTASAACVVHRQGKVSNLPRPGSTESVTTWSAVRAHLRDGQTIVFPHGFKVRNDTLFATDNHTPGRRYSLALAEVGRVSVLSLDSIVALETVSDPINVGMTILASPVTIAATAAVAVAVFGSCPTMYSDSAGTQVLEAEGFSYSIAPMFESPDLDRLRVRPDSTGLLRLEIRDEAYETHYLNHLGLVEVRHSPDEHVLPDNRRQPLAVGDLRAPVTAIDRTGRDVVRLLAAADGDVYRTPDDVLAHADARDPNDGLDLTFARPAGVDSVALVFHMRNSLLNTVLFYDLMLGDPGLKSLDWVGQDLANIGSAAALGHWYVQHLGMHVWVREGRDWREVGRVADTGPIAWQDVALRIPILEGDSIRVRITYLADDWRIDQVRLAARVRVPASRSISPVTLSDEAGRPDTVALRRISARDDQYLVTSSGQHFFLTFDAGRVDPGTSRTFLLASQGYYTEWLRGSWIRSEGLTSTFKPTDDALVEALHRWRSRQTDLERRFDATRVPVR